MENRGVKSIIVCMFIPLLVGTLAGLGTASHIDSWYANLVKPSFNPPGFLFGPVWTVLYILMGVTLYQTWTGPPGKNRIRALIIFGIQLALNFAWSFIFFKFHLITVALVEIALVWISVLSMIVSVRKVNNNAAYIQIPYLAWVTFASILNLGFWYLN